MKIGKERIKKKGKDEKIVQLGIGMKYEVKEEEEIEGKGIDVEIIEMRKIRKMDIEKVVEQVKKKGRIVKVEEGLKKQYVGKEIEKRVMKKELDYIDEKIMNIDGKEVKMNYEENIEKMEIKRVEEVVEEVKEVKYKD